MQVSHAQPLEIREERIKFQRTEDLRSLYGQEGIQSTLYNLLLAIDKKDTEQAIHLSHYLGNFAIESETNCKLIAWVGGLRSLLNAAFHFIHHSAVVEAVCQTLLCIAVQSEESKEILAGEELVVHLTNILFNYLDHEHILEHVCRILSSIFETIRQYDINVINYLTAMLTEVINSNMIEGDGLALVKSTLASIAVIKGSDEGSDSHHSHHSSEVIPAAVDTEPAQPRLPISVPPEKKLLADGPVARHPEDDVSQFINGTDIPYSYKLCRLDQLPEVKQDCIQFFDDDSFDDLPEIRRLVNQIRQQDMEGLAVLESLSSLQLLLKSHNVNAKLLAWIGGIAVLYNCVHRFMLIPKVVLAIVECLYHIAISDDSCKELVGCEAAVSYLVNTVFNHTHDSTIVSLLCDLILRCLLLPQDLQTNLDHYDNEVAQWFVKRKCREALRYSIAIHRNSPEILDRIQLLLSALRNGGDDPTEEYEKDGEAPLNVFIDDAETIRAVSDTLFEKVHNYNICINCCAILLQCSQTPTAHVAWRSLLKAGKIPPLIDTYMKFIGNTEITNIALRTIGNFCSDPGVQNELGDKGAIAFILAALKKYKGGPTESIALWALSELLAENTLNQQLFRLNKGLQILMGSVNDCRNMLGKDDVVARILGILSEMCHEKMDGAVHTVKELLQLDLVHLLCELCTSFMGHPIVIQQISAICASASETEAGKYALGVEPVVRILLQMYNSYETKDELTSFNTVHALGNLLKMKGLSLELVNKVLNRIPLLITDREHDSAASGNPSRLSSARSILSRNATRTPTLEIQESAKAYTMTGVLQPPTPASLSVSRVQSPNKGVSTEYLMSGIKPPPTPGSLSVSRVQSPNKGLSPQDAEGQVLQATLRLANLHALMNHKLAKERGIAFASIQKSKEEKERIREKEVSQTKQDFIINRKMMFLQKRLSAATKIQACWRGYKSRTRSMVHLFRSRLFKDEDIQRKKLTGQETSERGGLSQYIADCIEELMGRETPRRRGGLREAQREKAAIILRLKALEREFGSDQVNPFSEALAALQSDVRTEPMRLGHIYKNGNTNTSRSAEPKPSHPTAKALNERSSVSQTNTELSSEPASMITKNISGDSISNGEKAALTPIKKLSPGKVEDVKLALPWNKAKPDNSSMNSPMVRSGSLDPLYVTMKSDIEKLSESSQREVFIMKRAQEKLSQSLPKDKAGEVSEIGERSYRGVAAVTLLDAIGQERSATEKFTNHPSYGNARSLDQSKRLKKEIEKELLQEQYKERLRFFHQKHAMELQQFEQLKEEMKITQREKYEKLLNQLESKEETFAEQERSIAALLKQQREHRLQMMRYADLQEERIFEVERAEASQSINADTEDETRARLMELEQQRIELDRLEEVAKRRVNNAKIRHDYSMKLMGLAQHREELLNANSAMGNIVPRDPVDFSWSQRATPVTLPPIHRRNSYSDMLNTNEKAVPSNSFFNEMYFVHDGAARVVQRVWRGHKGRKTFKKQRQKYMKIEKMRDIAFQHRIRSPTRDYGAEDYQQFMGSMSDFTSGRSSPISNDLKSAESGEFTKPPPATEFVRPIKIDRLLTSESNRKPIRYDDYPIPNQYTNLEPPPSPPSSLPLRMQILAAPSFKVPSVKHSTDPRDLEEIYRYEYTGPKPTSLPTPVMAPHMTFVGVPSVTYSTIHTRRPLS